MSTKRNGNSAEEAEPVVEEVTTAEPEVTTPEPAAEPEETTAESTAEPVTAEEFGPTPEDLQLAENTAATTAAVAPPAPVDRFGEILRQLTYINSAFATSTRQQITFVTRSVNRLEPLLAAVNYADNESPFTLAGVHAAIAAYNAAHSTDTWAAIGARVVELRDAIQAAA